MFTTIVSEISIDNFINFNFTDNLKWVNVKESILGGGNCFETYTL